MNGSISPVPTLGMLLITQHTSLLHTCAMPAAKGIMAGSLATNNIRFYEQLIF